MKKLLFLLSCLLLFSFRGDELKLKSDLAILKVKGNVKSITINYLAVNTKEDGKDGDSVKWKTKTYYNRIGNAIDKKLLEGGAETKYRYDEHNNLVEQYTLIDLRLKTSDSIDSHFIYTFYYDDRGNAIMEKANYNGQFANQRIERKFDSIGNMIEYRLYTAKDSLADIATYKYDSFRNKIEECRYMGTGKMLYRYKYQYDKKGNDTCELCFHGFDDLYYSEIIKYDDSGNEVLTKFSYTDGSRNRYMRYEYSNVDEKGNWLKQITYFKDRPMPFEVIERTIEYY